MNFWNKLWGKKEPSEPIVTLPDTQPEERMERTPQAMKRPADTSASRHPSTGQIRISLDLEDNSYEANLFDIDFKQDINEKNELEGGSYGGIIFLGLKNIHSEHELCEWIAATRLYHDGEVRIYQESENGQHKTLLFSVVFKDACCISYRKQCHAGVPGVVTEIKIAPRSLQIGNEEFENQWNN